MSRRIVPVVSLGTYFAKGSPCSGANRYRMTGFFFRVKGNRTLTGSESVNHRWHPADSVRELTTPDTARKYAAEIFAARRDHILETLELDGADLAIVPVPSSKTTPVTAANGWGTLALAQAFARHGFGTVRPCVAFKEPHKSKTERTTGDLDLPADELRRALVRVGDLPERNVVIVDDLLTFGRHVAAVSDFIHPNRRIGAVTIACTDGVSVDDCMGPRYRNIIYDTSIQPWPVTVADKVFEEDVTA